MKHNKNPNQPLDLNMNEGMISHMDKVSDNKLLLIIIAIFITPLAVFLRVGLGMHFWINLLLYLGAIGSVAFLDFPYIGLVTMIHALVVILK